MRARREGKARPKRQGPSDKAQADEGLYATAHCVGLREARSNGRKASSESYEKKVFFCALLGVIAAEVASVQRCRQSISSSAHGQSRLADVRIAQRKGGSMDLGCASGAIYARYRQMASEMLVHGPPSGLCCAAVSNHNRCLDAPACCSSTSRSMVCAIPGTPVWLPTWPLPGGTVRDFQPADSQDKRESGPPLAVEFSFSPHHSPHSL